jgi:TetR/AcrR family transcriptional regulator, transcriptional repressor for nem operon
LQYRKAARRLRTVQSGIDMADKGEQTRERILAVAEPLILQQGFAGTSLDDIVARTGLTKGAFFHHFKGKGDLARALVERYARNDYELFEGFLRDAEAASGDPLEQTFAFLRGFEDFVLRQNAPLAGCVFAAYTYEAFQFDSSIHRFIGESFDRWSALYEAKFEAVLAERKSRRPVSARDLAQMITTIIEGGFILSRVYNDATLIARQSKQFRQYVELLFDVDVKPVRRKAAKR